MAGHPPPVRAFHAVAAVALLAACSGGEAASGGSDVRVDTLPGGVPRVVNVPPPEGLQPTLVAEPVVRIGSLAGTGPETFGQIKGLAVLPDGRIAVLESQAQEIRVFGPDGAYERTLGRKGQGPGEFQDANGLLAGPDGLLRVNDPRNARLSLVHPDEGPVSSTPMEVMLFGWVWDAVMDSAGRVYEPTLANVGEERWRVVRVWDAAGTWSDTVRIEPYERSAGDDDPPGVYVLRSDRMSMMTTVPFWPTAHRTTDPRGFFWSHPGGDNDYRVVQTTFTGDTLLAFESRRTPLPVAPAERDSAIAAIRERFDGEEMDWSKIPSEKPVVEGLSLDDRGRVWVRVASAEEGTTTWDVFARDGRWEETVVAPFAVVPWMDPVIVGDDLYALTVDALDVPYVVKARLGPAGEPSAGP